MIVLVFVTTICAVSSVFLVFFASAYWKRIEKKPEGMIISISGGDRQNLKHVEEIINFHGQQGWEIVHWNSREATLLFKR